MPIHAPMQCGLDQPPRSWREICLLTIYEAVAVNSDQARERAEMAFGMKLRDGQKRMTEYESRALVIREKTARLKALRLAKEVGVQKSKRRK